MTPTLRAISRALMVLVVAFIAIVPAMAAPGIEWSPSQISTSLGDGHHASTPLSVTFRSGEALNDVTVRVVPALGDFVTVTPSHFDSIAANHDYTVALTFSVAPYASPGYYDGTIHLIAGKRTLARPLPVVVQVDYGNNTISPRARVLSSATLALIASASANGATIDFAQSAAELSSLHVGDVLALPPTTALPDGLLAEITSIAYDGAHVIVHTVPASLADVLPDSDVSIAAHPAPDDEVSALSRTRKLGMASTAGPSPWTLEFADFPVYDHDGDPFTDDQVTLTGSVALDTSLSFDMKVRNAQLVRATLVSDDTLTAMLTLRGNVTIADFSKKCYLFSGAGTCNVLARPAIRIRPIVVYAGYIPIVITPVLNLAFGAEGSISTGISTSVTQTSTLRAGLLYENGTLTPISGFESSFTFEPPAAELQAQAKAYVGPQLDLLLYGVAGPHVLVDAFAEVNVEPFADPWWTLYGGLEARVGITVFRLFDEELPGVISFRKLLAQAPPRPCNTTPSGRRNGLMFVTGGTLAGQPLSASNWSITVPRGAAINGNVQFAATNLMPPSAVAPLGYTWTWGNRTTSIVGLAGWIPTGTTNWNVPINLIAPLTPGTYYLLFAFQGEFNMQQVMSATNWSTGTITWNDGNDLVDVSPCLLNYAHTNGFVPSWRIQVPNGYLAFDSPLAPVKIEVQ